MFTLWYLVDQQGDGSGEKTLAGTFKSFDLAQAQAVADKTTLYTIEQRTDVGVAVVYASAPAVVPLADQLAVAEKNQGILQSELSQASAVVATLENEIAATPVQTSPPIQIEPAQTDPLPSLGGAKIG